MKRLKAICLNWLIRDFLKGFTVDKTLQFRDGKIYLASKALTREDVERLQREAEMFSKSLVWKILNNEVRSEALKIGVERSISQDDNLLSKGMILNLDTINTLLQRLKSL